jgi:hypothetical protein
MASLRDFYHLSLGDRVILVFVTNGKFNIRLRDRFGGKVRCPKFCPSMKFSLDKNGVHFHLGNVFPVPFMHDEFNFQFIYEKRIYADELHSGFLVDFFIMCCL